MKRILLPLLTAIALPTAVEANPFSGDIVLKTNLGEKYIVKKKTVITTTNKIRIMKFVLSGESSRKIAKGYKDGTYGKVDDAKASGWIWEAERKEAEYPEFKAEMDKYNEEEIASYEIKYQPIFQNLNNFKIGMEQKEIICINPKFKNENFPKAYHDNFAESLELNVLDKKVCDKYAKF